MAVRIYLVEDEKSLNILLDKYLQREGYEVTTFFNGNSALERIKDKPDLWILDIMLPDIDGYQLIKAIKSENSKTPVILMSARNEELDRVVGLELGSDDYLSKPFLPRELIIRTNKIIERLYGKEKIDVLDKTISISEYTINQSQRTVLQDGTEIQLTNKEFELLLYFVENINHLVSREQILLKIWGDNYYGSDRVVDDTIRRLRKKMDKLTIDTVYGYGYKLVPKE